MKTGLIRILPIAVLTMVAAMRAAAASPEDSAARTARLVAVLQSDAAFFEKARACQQLGEAGTRDAVPTLAALLADPKLGAYARSGLEGIPDPSAAAALRTAAGQLQGMARVSVRDSGPGIDAERADKVFEPLASHKEYGLGVGLRISRSLIEAHGGRLWVEPHRPGGIFHFVLPFAT